MPKARTVTDVILGEAVSGSVANRYRDMKAIASTIANRARMLGVSPQDVVGNRREFNAYGKSLPAGVNAYRGLADRAWNEVMTEGPTHTGTFYATPAATKNLPRGLQPVTATTGHQYFSDPQNRAIGTAQGFKSPTGMAMASKKPSLAEQYRMLDTARGLNRDIGLLRQDVAAQDPMGQLRRDLIARNKAYEMATAPSLQPINTPVVAGAAAPVTAYGEPEIQPAAAAPFSSQPGISSSVSQRGLLSPEEELAVQRQQAFLASQPVNRRAQFAAAAKKGIGAFGGGVLGGMLLGPLGAVAGGLLGPSALNAMTQRPNFPAAPESKPRGDNKLTDYGRSVERESRQFREAMSKGGRGLY